MNIWRNAKAYSWLCVVLYTATTNVASELMVHCMQFSLRNSINPIYIQ
jgi:hypothetical protein